LQPTSGTLIGRPSAVERTLHHLSGAPDPPPTHIEASSPPEGHANANPDGNMATYRRAILGHASLTDSGAVPWSSKRQDIAPSDLLTTESDYVAATRRGKEVSWLRSAAPDISSDLKGPTTSILGLNSGHHSHHHTHARRAPSRGCRHTTVTPDWAALAMRPDTTLPHTNDSKAVDWCAILGHAFPIDGGTLGDFKLQASRFAPLSPSTTKSPTCSRRPCLQRW